MGRPRLLAALLGAALLLLAVAALRRGRGTDPVSPAPSPGTGAAPGPASKGDPDAPPRTPTSPGGDAPAPKPARLRVSVFSPDREIGGYVAAAAEGRRGEGQVEIGGRGRVEAVFKSLAPGRKRILFVPTSDHAPVSAELVLAPDQEGALELVPPPARALEGIVVDALRRPLAGARVKAVAEGAFEAGAASGPVVPLMSVRRMGSGGGPAVASPRSFHSFSAYSDGRLELATETDAAGRFRIAGLPGPTAQVLVGEGPGSMKRACAIDAEAYLIVPVVKEPLPEAGTPEGLRDSLAELAEKLGRDPQADEAYWAMMREELRKSVEASTLPARDKAFLRPLVDGLGRSAPPK